MFLPCGYMCNAFHFLGASFDEVGMTLQMID